MDCDFDPPVIQPCVAPEIIDVSTPIAAIDWPLLRPPCIPAFSGAVSVSSSGRVGDSQDIGLRPDPSSECGYRLSGAVDLPCVCDADAYVEGGMLKWYNTDGLQTTINGSIVAVSDSTGIAYNSTINYQFRFWYCHGTGGAGDRSVNIPSGGAGSPAGACVINAQAWVELDEEEEGDGRKVIRWQNVGGEMTILNENVAPWGGVTVSDTTGAHDGAWEYDPAIDYVFKFWKCNEYTVDDFTNPDIIVTIPAVEGTYAVPYILGTNDVGSGADGVAGPWGGVGDGPPPGLSDAQTDTWWRHQPPNNYSSGTLTDGVILVVERTYSSNSAGPAFNRKTFKRKPTYDTKGLLVGISAETLVEDDYVSGTGSADGGL